jgi:leucyl aminopeptidase
VKLFAESHNLEYEIIQGDELLEKGMNMIHAVGRTANSPPALAIVHYKGNPTEADNQ